MLRKKQIRGQLLFRAGDHEGTLHTLQGPETTIGSNSDCDIVVSGTFVSGIHAVIHRQSDTKWVITNQSVNGTLINQSRIEKQTLEPGDLIQIGSASLLEFRLTKEKTGDRGKAAGTITVNDEATDDVVVTPPKKGRLVSPMMMGGLAAYLVGMVIIAFVLSNLESGPESTRISREGIENLLAETRMLLESGESGACGSKLTPGDSYRMDGAADSAYLYHALVSLGGGKAKSERERLAGELLRQVEQDLFRAWRYESQERWSTALREYRRIITTLPDPRCPITKYALNRSSALNDAS